MDSIKTPKTAESVVTDDVRSTSSPALAGGEQVLERTHTFWSLMAYQTTILCSWSCNIVLLSYVFTLGGPASLVWGTVVVTTGNTLVMASLAEYCALWPSAGGQQFYTQLLAPAGCRRFLSYFVGWCVLVGEISTSAGCALNSADILAAFVQITHPEIDWRPWMTFLLYLVFLLLPLGFNLAPKLLPGFQIFGAAFNISAAITWAVVFLALAPKTDAAFIFGKFINESGWASNGWVFILSMYAPIYGLYGTDGVMHLTEEMRNPSRDGPRVMVFAMLWAGVTAWLTAIIMLYTIGPDWPTFLSASSAYLAWFMSVTGSTIGGGVFCALIMMGLNFLIIMNIYAAGSRLIYSMARDRAFPFSAALSQLSPRFHIPLRGLLLFLALNALTGLLVLASPLAFYAILSAGGLTLQLSYCAPILCAVLRGRGAALPPHRPHFDLGRWGTPVNVAALAWSVVVVLFDAFPQYLPVVDDVGNMNWCVAMLAGVFVFAGLYYLVKGRKEYLVDRPSLVHGVAGLDVGDGASRAESVGEGRVKDM